MGDITTGYIIVFINGLDINPYMDCDLSLPALT